MIARLHEFTEDVNDGSMCVCGVPALTHDQAMAEMAEEDGLREVERRVRALATAGDPVTHETVRQVVLAIIRDVAGAPYCSPKRRAEGWRCSAPCADHECVGGRWS